MKTLKHTAGLYFAFILLASCHNFRSESVSEPDSNGGDWDLFLSPEQFERNGLTLESPARRDFPEMIPATGIVDVPPGSRSLVSAVMGGFIRQTPLLVGDPVSQGQTIAILENPDYLGLQQEYLEGFEQQTYLREEFERQEKLLAENITSRKAFLRAESEYRQALAKISGLRGKLELLGIPVSAVEKGHLTPTIALRSPIQGTVTRIFTVKGEYVAPESPVLEVINGDHMHLELNVFERDVLKVGIGQQVRFTIPETARDTFPARVIQIGKALREDRTVRVHADIDPAVRARFLIGMFVNASIEAATHQSPALPLHAISETDNGSFIYLLGQRSPAGYGFVRRQVQLGERWGERIEWQDAPGRLDTLRILGQVGNVN